MLTHKKYRVKSELHFFTRNDHLKLLEHCPNEEWRAILTLARYAGVRCPCEVMQLRWTDIDWNGKRMSVPNPKWTPHPHKRIMPLFPEVRRKLRTLFELAPDNEFIINQFTNRAKANLAASFMKIAKSAGIGVHMQPLSCMRLSRFSELTGKFGRFCASVWLGVEPEGNEKFIRLMTDIEIQQAADWEGGS